ncbi:MAG: Aerotolerance protein BatA [uncultured Friedmanniella sp.]|uniref:Aerotolerance protein BatA n=1 Tax=uncultured Friedmanniella sp. TaxID=335381 RepID=A0A6J4LLD9_9ACTN|nr:VWA domain-containing protein [uncultured Friedmanniella sp.]CAA9334009.1 MAG: Aerotolerance protein BatA [uncultured Friedmanniella sp.]
MSGPLVGLVPQLAFLAPERLLILLVIPLMVAAYIFASRRKNRRGMRFTNTSMLEVVVPKQSQWRRHVAVALSLLSLLTLTAAFARPKTQVDVPRERATVVLVLDASLSMQATDVRPSRLAAAKLAATDFVEQLPEKYNVALVSMAGSTSILVPPTTAHNTVANAINSIQLQDSTAIGEGIAAGLRALQQAPQDPDNPDSVAPGAIVLLSDGYNTAGRSPQQAAAEAGAANVPVYTIAYGTENGYVDLEGKREPVPVDHESMQRVAELSNGEYFAAATAEQLQSVYENIGSEVGYEKADREVTARFAGYGLALAVLAALGAISLGARWP